MKKRVSRRAVSIVLALAMAVGCLFTNVVPVKAADDIDYLYVSTSEESLSAGVEVKRDFTVNTAGDVFFMLYPYSTEVNSLLVTLYDSAGNVVSIEDNPMETTNYTVWYSSEDGTYQYAMYSMYLEAGDYSYGIKCDVNNYFQLAILAEKTVAKISNEKITLTAGFSKKLSVEGGEVKSWASSKTSVATVDKKTGKVTAKKKGTATITATLTDGTKLKCKVTVKENKYSSTKITSSDVSYNEYGAKAYSASFDKNGNLVVKVMIVNGGYGRLAKIAGFRVAVKDQNGKTVATYKKSSYSVSVPSYSEKSYTITFKKSSKVSKTKIDLRNSTITVDGGTGTTYY